MDSLKIGLKALRINAEKTQQELADFLGINLKTYQNWESDPDRIPWSKIKLLAHYYEVPVSIIE